MPGKKIVATDTAKCEGCNRCVRVCPLEEANVAYTEDGAIKIRIDPDKCIACGACVEACQHEARYFTDDTDRFFADLARGEKISLIVAPAMRSNFPNWESILAWLRGMGVSVIVDVSFGADICTWAHIRYIQQNSPETVITQPCPAIVNYIEKYQPQLLSALSPVHSPMLCTAIFLRKYQNVQGKIGALSPCIAKTHEFEQTGYVHYNITFAKLAQYIQEHNIRIPQAEFEFNNIPASLGRVYAMPGGLKENVEFYLGHALRVDKSEGTSTVYRHLDQFAHENKANLPQIFDVLNCAEGCNVGTGCDHATGEGDIFHINTIMDRARSAAAQQYPKTAEAEMTALFEKFDRNLRLEDFIRRYTPMAVRAIPYTPEDEERAMLALGKTTPAQRSHNCYACGCETCQELAVRIAKGINVPENCMEKTRQEIIREHEAFRREQDTSRENLERISAEVGDIRRRFEEVLASVGDVEQVIAQYSVMTKLVDDIAMQTQLLSFNASVEAARAGGDAGKGFAVVAQSIGDLAGKTKSTIAEVSDTGAFAEKTIGTITQSSRNVEQSIGRVSDYLDQMARFISNS